jgi:hypothetical protein
MASRTNTDGLIVGEGATRREIAVIRRDGAGPGLFWLGGFNSDMAGTKALALAHAAQDMDADYFDALVDVHSRKRASDEAVEGLASFREKRDPAWYPG